jgi:chromate reductase
MVPSILLISGSVRVGSVNAAVIATVADLVKAPFAAATYDELVSLPQFNQDLDHDPLPEKVVELRAAIRDASALLISTPEYAGAMPGALKNLGADGLIHDETIRRAISEAVGALTQSMA